MKSGVYTARTFRPLDGERPSTPPLSNLGPYTPEVTKIHNLFSRERNNNIRVLYREPLLSPRFKLHARFWVLFLGYVMLPDPQATSTNHLESQTSDLPIERRRLSHTHASLIFFKPGFDFCLVGCGGY